MSEMRCSGDHDYSVVREMEEEPHASLLILCSRCGDVRIALLPRTPIPDEVRKGME